MGAENRPATEHELAAMVALVAEGLADGAVGVSTGLDYTPGLFADADEIAAVCAPLAGTGLPYVSHMRGGYEENARVGVEEAGRIGRAAGVGVHLSHFHPRADLAHELMEWLDAQGVSASYDAYPYTRGCSIMGMMLLPPELNALPPAEAVAVIPTPRGATASSARSRTWGACSPTPPTWEARTASSSASTRTRGPAARSRPSWPPTCASTASGTGPPPCGTSRGAPPCGSGSASAGWCGPAPSPT
ncbi:hypothetical protein [Propioniciclava flava]|uniref:hypothetical protein n=1 Tax=Propioniciclava flava TaxID=2072026 RepID=UPI0019D5B455|nr:hypothetical protein [Propioniciclava flava]